MKKRNIIALGIIAVMLFAGIASAMTFITIGSGGVGGTYYRWAESWLNF